eukprot:scaffold26551_cov115-Isochrysis_galbana.AAC.1
MLGLIPLASRFSLALCMLGGLGSHMRRTPTPATHRPASLPPYGPHAASSFVAYTTTRQHSLGPSATPLLVRPRPTAPPPRPTTPRRCPIARCS